MSESAPKAVATGTLLRAATRRRLAPARSLRWWPVRSAKEPAGMARNRLGSQITADRTALWMAFAPRTSIAASGRATEEMESPRAARVVADQSFLNAEWRSGAGTEGRGARKVMNPVSRDDGYCAECAAAPAPNG